MRNKKNFILETVFFLLLIFVTGCQSPTGDRLSEQAAFDCFTNEIFVSEVQSDSITLNYTLSHPENYGITNYEATIGDYSLESHKEDLALSENYLSRLKNFHYKQLSPEQQLTYDILSDTFSFDKNAEDFLLYEEILGPTTGLQAQLPVLLAEYNFNSKEDINQYLNLLPCVYDYFQEIVTFQQEKSKAGLFMSDNSADSIIKQCETFIEKTEENYLIDVFNDKTNNFKNATQSEILEWQAANKKAILDKIIPAYKLLIKGLNDLKGTGKNTGGLYHFPKGKEYYESLLKENTGSSKSVKEIDKLLDSTINASLMNMSSIAMKDSEIYDKFTNLVYPLTDPKEIMEYLKIASEKDFPELESVNYTIKYVHKSLEDHLSPAFYLTPPIDNFTQNNIYINRGKDFDLSEIFTTIAHEGYPGHLYQTVFYNEQSPSPIRNILSFGGYSEGWATYVEMYSYQLAKIDANLAEFLKNNMIATLCLYGKVDIGVNYKGWTLEDTQKYLADFGISDEDSIHAIQESMIAEPTNYMKYILGYLEFTELRDMAKAELKDEFVLKDFHEFILKTGPCQFDILKERLKMWMKEQ